MIDHDPIDPFQAVSSAEVRNLLVIAPPGCGKTELLARRAQKLLPLINDGQKILALTFSNKAKANLDNRLTEVLGAERKRRYVTVRNFHGHAAEVVRSHGRTLHIDVGFEMPDKRTQGRAVSRCVDPNAYDLIRQIDEELSAAKQSPRSDAEVLEFLAETGDERARSIEEQRQHEGSMFYDDLLRHAQRLLRVPEVARLYRAHYRVVLVDEFQDLSPQQLDIALRSCDASRVFVGDPLQGIYSWTGARPIRVERILRRICGDPFGLGMSYRSSPRVLDLVSVASRRLGGQTLESHEPDQWFEGGMTAGVGFDTASEEAQFIRTTCEAILSRRPSSTIGVICRNGWRRKPIDLEFATTESPCTRWDLAVDNARVVELLCAGLARTDRGVSLDDLRVQVLSSIDPSDVDTASDVTDAIDQMRDAVDEAGSIAGALAQMRIREISEDAVPPGVHLLNAHTGKGQQFDWVFIPGLEKGNVPSFLAKSKLQLEEEDRVMLVMLSRARHGVVLTKANTLISKAGRPYTPDTSHWVNLLAPALAADADGLAGHIQKLPTDRSAE